MAFERDDCLRELQLASLSDLQGSVQAIDNKSSAALVVHGLLFAGIVSVAANISDVVDEATLGAQIVGALFLVAIAGTFAVSVLSLIAAVRPVEGEADDDPIRGTFQRAFFPPPDPAKSATTRRDDQVKRLEAIKTPEALRAELAAEQVKLARIRAVQAAQAKRGFDWLRLELVPIALFLLLVVLVSVGLEPAAR